jgi:hypothetical protein
MPAEQKKDYSSGHGDIFEEGESKASEFGFDLNFQSLLGHFLERFTT